MRVHLKNQTKKWVQNYQVENAQLVVNPKDKRKTSLEGTAGTENPQYFMFWTNEDLLNLVGQSIVDNSNDDSFLPLGPSSSVLIEYTAIADNKNDMNVQVFINDQLVKSKFCNFQDTCLASAFANSLEAAIQDQDVSKVCQGK